MNNLLHFDAVSASILTGGSLIPPLDHTEAGLPGGASDWRMIMVDESIAGVAGAGEIFGTGEQQAILILPLSASVVLDSSFNRGGDILVFDEDADAWDILVSGSNAIISNGFTNTIVPVGPAGLKVQFDDGERLLRVDTDQQEVLIGNQVVTTDYTAISAPAGSANSDPDFIVDPEAVGRVLLNPEGQIYLLGFFDIFGTDQEETLFLLNGEFDLDPSFNRGGDTIVLPSDRDTFEAYVDGSTAIFENAPLLITIPVGANGTEFSFADADEQLLYVDLQQGKVFIGDQELTNTPMTLMG